MTRALVEHLLEYDRCEHFGKEPHFVAVLASSTYGVLSLIHEEFCIYCVDERVLLRDVSTITLKEGQYTTGRRVAPVPQLKCVGGGACYKYQPRFVQCVKQGYDGSDYQWKCTADMPRQYKFGMVTVTCEGYNYPDDPYILKGSCGLEYELEYAESAREVGRSKTKWPSLFFWPR
uniref:Store-operated calcium entry-associated regulatory factor n=1 Tax=Angiostrongylus cantonensis TaxID=6313 RepID=A0A0K0DDX7_ANGCA